MDSGRNRRIRSLDEDWLMTEVKIKGLDMVDCPLCDGSGNLDERRNQHNASLGLIGFSWSDCNLCKGEGKIPLYIKEEYDKITLGQSLDGFTHKHDLRQILEDVYEGKIVLEETDFDKRVKERMERDLEKELENDS